jgi:hypothetical protein
MLHGDWCLAAIEVALFANDLSRLSVACTSRQCNGFLKNSFIKAGLAEISLTCMPEESPTDCITALLQLQSSHCQSGSAGVPGWAAESGKHLRNEVRMLCREGST